jgi:type I restriction enzyme, S subunit
MKTISTNCSSIQDFNLRLDAGYHLSEGQLTLSLFKQFNIPTLSLSKVTERIFYGGRARRVYVKNPNCGLPFIKGADIIKADLSSLSYISRKRTANLDEYFVEEGWTLLTRSGTIGNTAFVTKDFLGKAASDDIIRVVPKNILPGFLYAFLSSKHGSSLLTHGTYGAVIQHIEPEHIEDLPVPIFSHEKQQQIHDLITHSAALRVEANKLLGEAIGYFNEQYCISEDRAKQIFIKSVNDLSFSWAAYNNNIGCDIITRKFGGNYFKLGDEATRVFAPPLFKHIYIERDNGNPFLTGSELTQCNPRIYRYLSPRGVKDINDYKVHKGTLLLYKSGTTDGGILGSVFIVDDILSSVCLSDHVIRISLPNLQLSYWIYAFLKSDAGIKLLQRLATGSMIPFITPERLKNVPIPNPNEKFNQIVSAVEGHLEKQADSKIKENQAIQLIEKEIDQWQN